MRKSAYFMLLLLPLLAACSSGRVYTDMAKGTDIRNYRSYAWVMPPDSVHHIDPIADQNVRYYVDKEMLKRGFVVNTQDPDLLLDFHAKEKQRRGIVREPVYRGGFGFSPWGWGMRPWMMGPATIARPVVFREALLVVDVKDRESGKHLWRGFSVEEVQRNTFSDRKLSSDVQRIFKRFPVQVLR